jgi:enoyl-CoA hydratase/carnithine racemase
MGGGTELSLACRYRIASRDPSTKIGLPEVMLGIHPGWGGSARLPRLIGATDALPIMLTGKALSAEAARSLGVVDSLTSPELLLEGSRGLIRHPRQQRPMAARESLGDEYLAGADPRADRPQADRGESAARPISGAIRADRSLAPRRFRASRSA